MSRRMCRGAARGIYLNGFGEAGACAKGVVLAQSSSLPPRTDKHPGEPHNELKITKMTKILRQINLSYL